jgi:hypothetical protein
MVASPPTPNQQFLGRGGGGGGELVPKLNLECSINYDVKGFEVLFHQYFHRATALDFPYLLYFHDFIDRNFLSS